MPLVKPDGTPLTEETLYQPGFYIAGKFTARARLRKERDRLLESLAPLVCFSEWLDMPDDMPHVPDDLEYCRREAKRDLLGVVQSDLFFIDTLDESNTGGREVELGICLAMPRVCIPILIGPVRNIFHALIAEAHPDWESVHANIAAQKAEGLVTG